MNSSSIEAFAHRLWKAYQKKEELTRLTLEEPELGVEEGYQIQEYLRVLFTDEGHEIIGHKMGLTSQAKMEQMGVDEPIAGFLTNKMQHLSGDEIEIGGFIHPKVEPELAFELAGDIPVGETLEDQDFQNVIGKIAIGLEIIDSRYRKFDFKLPDVIADNCSAAAYVLGDWKDYQGEDLSSLGVVLSQNGEAKHYGSTKAILGHPFQSLLALIELLKKRKRGLKRGEIILTGAATPAISVQEGDQIAVSILGLPDLSCSIVR